MTANPAIALAVSYAPRAERAALAAVFAVDARLAEIVRSTTEPLVGQMRLTWWREALEALDRAPPPGEPVLRALADEVLPYGVRGALLAEITDGWEALLADPLDAAAIEGHAERGAALFAALAAVTGAADATIDAAGRGWALADLATHLGDPAAAAEAAAQARIHLQAARRRRWSRAGRPIGALALLAEQDLDGVAPPLRIARLAWRRLTGR